MLLCADMGLIVRLRHSLFFVSAKAGPCYLFQIILAQVTSVIYCFPNSYGSDPTKYQRMNQGVSSMDPFLPNNVGQKNHRKRDNGSMRMSIYSYTFNFDTFKNDTFKNVIFSYSQKWLFGPFWDYWRRFWFWHFQEWHFWKCMSR